VRRREFITLLARGAAQQLDRMRRIGVLMGYPARTKSAFWCSPASTSELTFAVAKSPQWQTDITIRF
jgi:hypothetical protein